MYVIGGPYVILAEIAGVMPQVGLADGNAQALIQKVQAIYPFALLPFCVCDHVLVSPCAHVPVCRCSFAVLKVPDVGR